MLIFELHGIQWCLSVMRISYKLTKRTTKTEKYEKFLKTNNIKNFKAIRCKLTALRNINYSILNSKLMRPLSILRLHTKDIKKTVKNSKVKKCSEKKVSEQL